MQATISNTLVKNLKPTNKAYDVRDTKLTGFIVRVNPSGSMNFVCQYKRGKRINIGKVGVLTPAQARDRAKEILADSIKGIDPNAAQQLKRKDMSLQDFIVKEYLPWVSVHRKNARLTVDRIKRCFYKDFAQLPLNKVTVQMIDKWRTERMNIGRSKQTVNVDIATFKAALSKAVEWEILDENPLKKLKLLQVDHHPSVRYLSVDEEQQLRKTLMDRETKVRLARDNANHWRETRGYSLLPAIAVGKFADHLRPMVLLSMNTGIRQGELFSLTWEDIDFKQATITIAGYKAKSGKTRV